MFFINFQFKRLVLQNIYFSFFFKNYTPIYINLYHYNFLTPKFYSFFNYFFQPIFINFLPLLLSWNQTRHLHLVVTRPDRGIRVHRKKTRTLASPHFLNNYPTFHALKTQTLLSKTLQFQLNYLIIFHMTVWSHKFFNPLITIFLHPLTERFDEDLEFYLSSTAHLTGRELAVALAKKERLKKLHNFQF